MNHLPPRLRPLIILGFALTLSLFSAACGHMVTKPTAVPPTATPTITPTSTSTSNPTATPAPYTPEPTATPTLEPTPVIHAIQSGETLIAIAQRYGVSVQAIQEANGIVEPRLLRVNQELIIPTDEESRLGAGTPTPAPTPPPLDISSILFGADPKGGLWALGEVSNPDQTPLEGVTIRLTLLDDAGETLQSADTPILADLLEPGEKSPFGIRFEAPPQSFANYFAEITRAYPAHLSFYYRDLEVAELNGAGQRHYAYEVSGLIRNIGPEDAVQVGVNVTLYDALDNVVGFRRVEPEHNVIPRGGETTFTAAIIPVGGPVVNFQVFAEARRILTPTPQP